MPWVSGGPNHLHPHKPSIHNSGSYCVVQISTHSSKNILNDRYHPHFAHKEAGTRYAHAVPCDWASTGSRACPCSSPPLTVLRLPEAACFLGSAHAHLTPLADAGPGATLRTWMRFHSFPAQNVELDCGPCVLALSHQLAAAGHPQRLGPVCLSCSHTLFPSPCPRLHPGTHVDMLIRRKTKFTCSRLSKGIRSCAGSDI